MKTETKRFVKIFDGIVQYTIPVYQRNYEWKTSNCEKLITDIMSMNEYYDHNINMLYVSSQTYADGMNKYRVIDGQQRITTISLLFCAIVKYLKENKAKRESYEKIIERYLINKWEVGNNWSKICFNTEDSRVYCCILNHVVNDESLRVINEESFVYKNFLYFYDFIENNIKNIEDFIKKIDRVTCVFGMLDDRDNPQQIFDGLNNTGVKLSVADIVRNALLEKVSDDEQIRLYNEYWKPFENCYKGIRESITQVLVYYTQIKSKQYFPQNRLPQHILNLNMGVEELFKELRYYSDLYLKINGAEEDYELNEAFDRVIQLDKTSRVVLLKLYKDYLSNKFSKKEFLELINFVETIIVRGICAGLSRSLGGGKWEIFLNKSYPNNYVISFKNTIRNSRWQISDMQIKQHLIGANFYTIGDSNSKNVIWESMENHISKDEPVTFRHTRNKYSVEHIMPQTLTPELKRELGSEWYLLHSNYKDVLGNLTIVGKKINSSMKNKSFVDKINSDKGLYDSRYNLNKDLLNKSSWGIEDIKDRTRYLTNILLEIWPNPHLTLDYGMV